MGRPVLSARLLSILFAVDFQMADGLFEEFVKYAPHIVFYLNRKD